MWRIHRRHITPPRTTQDDKECSPMGQLIDGVWHDTNTTEVKKDGQFVRQASAFRSWITEDGAPGPTGEGGFKAETGRYHLYVSLACPWAHRALIYRSVLGLEHAISVSVVHPVNMENGWEFSPYEGATPDQVNNARFMHQVYTEADPTFTGKVTVPVLWDKQTGRIVNNESSEIIRILGGAFRSIATSWKDFCPADLLDEIDEVNELVYSAINNGVYRTGFAQSQEAYEAAVTRLFDAFDVLEERLATQHYLNGDRPLESDWRLFTSMIRFPSVYYFHFKCNIRSLDAYPRLKDHTRRLLNYPGVRATVNLDHINTHYYMAHRKVNPFGIIPLGANIDLDGPEWGPQAMKEAV
jgi:putative glutathione S-transferase